MISLDQRFLIRNNQERRQQQKKQQGLDEDEETLSYAPVPKSRFINERGDTFQGVFDDRKAINTAPSIFDATAVFHTKK